MVHDWLTLTSIVVALALELRLGLYKIKQMRVERIQAGSINQGPKLKGQRPHHPRIPNIPVKRSNLKALIPNHIFLALNANKIRKLIKTDTIYMPPPVGILLLFLFLTLQEKSVIDKQ